MAQRGRGAAAGARPAARTGAARGDRARGDGARRDDAGRGDLRRSGAELAAIRDRLRAIIEPAVISAGLDVDDLVVVPAGRRLVVRVTVDGDDGVSHDALTAVSREISARLDAAEEQGPQVTPDSYTLEVSSPGVDRPLILPRQWRRNIGRLVKAKAGDRLLSARIAAVDEYGVTLDADGQAVSVPFADLGPGRVQIEFTRLAELTDDDLVEFGQDDDDDDEDEEAGELDDADEDEDHDDDEVTDIDLDEPQEKEDGA